ncbi:MAG TPA: hypothetical protein VMV72_18990 [Verrucomicrobiae bacterium]|nr:hypothetical protein [Verrucomicrobiae bacterium]
MSNLPVTPLSKLASVALQSFEHPATAAAKRQAALMRHLMSGEATFVALKEAVESLVGAAPKDHDVMIHAFGISVLDVRFLKPHSFLFRGFDQDGNQTSVVVHYSQMVARVVYVPKRGQKRVVTGFSVQEAAKT